jgi:voltage-dependent calcium channel
MTKWFWVALALTSLTIQATRTVDPGPVHSRLLNTGELVITIAFDVEIIVRFASCLPDWRDFSREGRNWLDLILAIGSTVIQIPPIRSSSAYPWLTIFQLLRFYRVILEVPRMKPLLVSQLEALNEFNLLLLTPPSSPSLETCTE